MKKETLNYNKDKLALSKIHSKLRYRYGSATHCSNKNCLGKSKSFQWCKKTGREYTKNPNDYLWLCIPCHRKYDLTPEKKEKLEKNLWWNTSEFFSMKLTPEQVKEIKVKLRDGELVSKIAKEFKCHTTNIYQIKLRKIWKKITI